MLDRVTTASLVLAAVPALGASHAAICRETGLGKGAVDAALLGLLRGRCLVRMPDGRYMRPECVKRDTETVVGQHCPPGVPRERRSEVARKAAEARREQRLTGAKSQRAAMRERGEAQRSMRYARYDAVLRMRAAGKWHSEMAQALGVSESTARRLVLRALRWDAQGRPT